MSTQFTMTCWNSTQNPPEVNKTTMFTQCMKFVRALQSALTGGQIVLPSRDKDESKKGIEIMVFYQAGTGGSFDSVSNFLTQKANDDHLDYKSFAEQEYSLTRGFTDSEMANIRSTVSPIQGELSETEVQGAIDRIRASTGYSSLDAWEKEIPKSQVSEPFQLTTKRLQSLRNARGDALKDELIGIMDGLNAAVAATKTSWATLIALGSGLVAVGGYIAGATTALVTVGSEIAGIFLLAAIVGTGPVALAIAAIVALIALVAGILYLVFKDALNVLLVVNNMQTDVRFRGDRIINGDRGTITNYLPSNDPKSPPAGFLGSVGTYGSEFGASFTRAGADFSVGMDCPNSAFGGRNSIRVTPGLDARKAAELAGDSRNEDDQFLSEENGRTSVRRANPWGNINWGVCLID
ncbi:MAG: hypothetical protein M1830_005477 [Pleopsidium flavum]|nr:MAG: hypothetical protein M1830_005477 [Pleopsidium flavum]